MVNKTVKGLRVWIGLLCISAAAGALSGKVWAQPGSSNVNVYDPAMVRDGDQSPGNYLRDFRQPRQDRTDRPQEQIRILIKEGKKIYCAWSNQLLHNDVQYKEVTPEEASKYFDDGTNNDEIAFDGLPSRVLVNNYDYLSPYGWQVKENLERLKTKMLLLSPGDDPQIREQMEEQDPALMNWLKEQRGERLRKRLALQKHLSTKRVSESKPSQWKDMDLWDPLDFYSGLHVVSLDGKSELPKFVDKLQDLTLYAKSFDENYIDQFKGYEPYPDRENPAHERELYRNWEPENKVLQKRRDNLLPGGGLQQTDQWGGPGDSMDMMMPGGPMGPY